MKRFSARRVAGFIFLALIGILVFGSIVRLLWNALLPELFHFPVITFWQALGLLLLAKILFGGFRGGGPGGRWKGQMKRRWMNMTPEEREKFKQDWGKRCGRPFEREEASFQEGPSSSERNSPSERNSSEKTSS